MSGIRHFAPPGPVSQAFLDFWDAMAIAINGPVGSGKTTTLYQKALRAAQFQPPSKIDGRARCKILVVRDTYPNMESTINSWHNLVPADAGEKTGSFPPKHKFTVMMERGGHEYPLDIYVKFRAIGDGTAEDALKGEECTFSIVNEADQVPKDTIPYLLGRGGRYPSLAHGESFFTGVLCDFNAPNHTNWTYNDFYLDRPDGYAFYRLPGGLSEGAENLQNLPGGRGFYERQAANPDKFYVRRMVHNEPGYSRVGEPVFPEFSSDLHVQDALEVLPDQPLYLGMDQGNNPGVVFMQPDAFGQVRVLDEIHKQGCFGTELGGLIYQKLIGRFRGLQIAMACVDPSGFSKSNDTTWAKIIEAETQLRLTPAPTNAIAPRLDCVRNLLVKRGEGGRAMLIIDRDHCPSLCAAMVGGYQYKSAGGDVADVPLKNKMADIADAFQYGVLGCGGYDNLAHRQKATPSRVVRPKPRGRVTR